MIDGHEANCIAVQLPTAGKKKKRKPNELLSRLAAAKEIRVAAAETAGFIRIGQCFHIKRRRKKTQTNTFKASGVKLITTAATKWSF